MDPGATGYLEHLRIEQMIEAGRPPTVIARHIRMLAISDQAKQELGKLVIESHPMCRKARAK